MEMPLSGISPHGLILGKPLDTKEYELRIEVLNNVSLYLNLGLKRIGIVKKEQPSRGQNLKEREILCGEVCLQSTDTGLHSLVYVFLCPTPNVKKEIMSILDGLSGTVDNQDDLELIQDFLED